MSKAVILAAARTPVARMGGKLKKLEGYQLGAIAVKEAIKRSGINPEDIVEVYMGNAEGAPGNLGRCIALEAGLPQSVPGIQIDRQCASGLEAINFATAMIESGHGQVYVAGGAESQSNNPYFMTKSKRAYSYAYPSFFNVMMVPPEYEGNDMGETAEKVLDMYPDITREDMDKFAYESHQKAKKAIESGAFKEQIVPVAFKERGKEVIVDTDDDPAADSTLESLAAARAVFRKNGRVTAGNSCPQNDAAAAVVITSEEKAKELGVKPLLEVVDFVSAGLDPSVMGLGPIYAVKKLLEKTGVSLDEIELIELNEAFSSQSLACIKELGLDPKRVNPNGGAIALGHPLGATGAFLTTKAAYAMKNAERDYCIVTMCVGGGEGAATLFKRIK